MIPAGYLLKRVKPPEAWLTAPHVTSVCSAACCVNDDVADLLSSWLYNDMGVASDPEILYRRASETGADMTGAELHYYEAHEFEMDSDRFGPDGWVQLSRLEHGAAAIAVKRPVAPLELLGYDVVVFEDFLDHSPLSCNGVAAEVAVNENCLFATLDEAKTAMETGVFAQCEPGIYKIYSVSRVG